MALLSCSLKGKAVLVSGSKCAAQPRCSSVPATSGFVPRAEGMVTVLSGWLGLGFPHKGDRKAPEELVCGRQAAMGAL